MQFKIWLINEEIFEKGNKAVVYHRTGKQASGTDTSIEGILNHGYKIGHGQAYGPGLYTLVNLEEQLKSNMDGYGDKILKIVINDLRNYIITIPYFARKIFNDPNITLQKQIEILGIQLPKDDPTIERYNSKFGFDNPTSDMSVNTGFETEGFVDEFGGLYNNKNCKGIFYRDSHGLVLLLYAPFDNILPLAWAKIPYHTRDPKQLIWHNIKNFAKINFADANFDYKTTPRRLRYKVPSAESSGANISAREAVNLLKFLADQNNFDADQRLYQKKFESAFEFFKAKNMRTSLLFKNLPKYVIKNMSINDLTRILDDTNNNNKEIMQIVQVKDLSSYDLDIIFATCPKMTNDPLELRKDFLRIDKYNPNLQNIAASIDKNSENINNIIDFLIAETSSIGKKLDLTYLARISPIVYLKQMIKQNELDANTLNKTIANIKNSKDIGELVYIIDSGVGQDLDAYQKLINHMIAQGFSLHNDMKNIPEKEIAKYFASANNTAAINYKLDNGYYDRQTGANETPMFYELFFKYVPDPTDAQLESILNRERTNSYDPVEFEKVLDLIIQFRKSRNQLLNKKELIQVIDAAKRFSKESILDKVDDKNWAEFDNSDIPSLVYKFQRYQNSVILTKVAEKFLAFNPKLDTETKEYFDKVITDPKNANKYIMLPSAKAIDEIAQDVISGDSYHFSMVLSQVLHSMGNVQLPPEKMIVLEKMIYDFAIARMNSDKPSANMIDRVIHYLEQEIPASLDAENFIKNIPFSILQKIFIHANYMRRFQTIIDKLKAKNNINLSNVFDEIKNKLASDPKASQLLNLFKRKFRTGAYHY